MSAMWWGLLESLMLKSSANLLVSLSPVVLSWPRGSVMVLDPACKVPCDGGAQVLMCRYLWNSLWARVWSTDAHGLTIVPRFSMLASSPWQCLQYLRCNHAWKSRRAGDWSVGSCTVTVALGPKALTSLWSQWLWCLRCRCEPSSRWAGVWTHVC